jgi:cytidylate kinase
MVIAIDGPAASGKSTTAKAVAQVLGFCHVDSGALYRAATAARHRRGGNSAEWTESDVLDAARDVTLVSTPGGFEPHLAGAPVEDEMRSAEVTAAVSRVAQMQRVRAWVNARMREAAEQRDVVVDGRDMGTAVFPEAELKVYLIADSWNRARRRVIQRGVATPSDEAIAEEMVALISRDARDAAQSVQAADAVLIDTSDITQAEQIAHIVALARAVRAR